MGVKYEYDKTTNPKDKIRLLERLISLTPDHKGTEKLLAQLRRTLSKLKDESERKKKGGGKRFGFEVKKEGAAQIVLIGAPSSGKSSLLAALTSATPAISPVPFTTKVPEIGAIKWLNVAIQVVEVPAIFPEGEDNPRWLGIARNAELIILVVDSTKPGQLKQLREELEAEAIDRPTIVVYTKGDLSRQGNAIAISNQWAVDDLKAKIWHELGLIRVYTRTRFTEPDYSRPITLSIGSTVMDLAKQIHKDFMHNLQYARIWRGKFKGLRAGADYELKDGDIVELVI